MIKRLHLLLKTATTDSDLEWFRLGDYKALPNTVGGRETASPEEVPGKMARLLAAYRRIPQPAFGDILAFHVDFEAIHPFQDGNGRVGRLILFKECLAFGIIPFIIDEEHKMYYYRGLREYKKEPGYLNDTCLSAQDKYRAVCEKYMAR